MSGIRLTSNRKYCKQIENLVVVLVLRLVLRFVRLQLTITRLFLGGSHLRRLGGVGVG